MSLSKKNLDKLNTFIKKNDLPKDHNISNSKNTVEKHQRTKNPTKFIIMEIIFRDRKSVV